MELWTDCYKTKSSAKYAEINISYLEKEVDIIYFQFNNNTITTEETMNVTLINTKQLYLNLKCYSNKPWLLGDNMVHTILSRHDHSHIKQDRRQSTLDPGTLTPARYVGSFSTLQCKNLSQVGIPRSSTQRLMSCDYDHDHPIKTNYLIKLI